MHSPHTEKIVVLLIMGILAIQSFLHFDSWVGKILLGLLLLLMLVVVFTSDTIKK